MQMRVLIFSCILWLQCTLLGLPRGLKMALREQRSIRWLTGGTCGGADRWTPDGCKHELLYETCAECDTCVSHSKLLPAAVKQRTGCQREWVLTMCPSKYISSAATTQGIGMQQKFNKCQRAIPFPKSHCPVTMLLDCAEVMQQQCDRVGFRPWSTWFHKKTVIWPRTLCL